MAPLQNPPSIAETYQPRFFAHVLSLLREHHGVAEVVTIGNNAHRVTLSSGDEFEFFFEGLNLNVVPISESAVNLRALVSEANRNAAMEGYGGLSWWTIDFESDPQISERALLHMVRATDEHSHRRFEGTWRLGDDSLVTWTQIPTAAPFLFPRFNVHVIFSLPGTEEDSGIRQIAAKQATILRAALTFLTGAPLRGFPIALWPADETESAAAIADLSRSPYMPLDGQPFWPRVLRILDPGHWEAFDRLKGALFSYEQGLAQDSPHAALVMFVGAIEALGVPNTSWKTQRATARFQHVCRVLAAERVATTMQHPNFGETFGNYTSTQRFLSEVYELRSIPLHTGLIETPINASPLPDTAAMMKVAYISRLARDCITEFLDRPISALIGHPQVDRAI